MQFPAEKSKGFIQIKEASGTYSVEVKANTPVKWMLDYAAFPPPIITLQDNYGREIVTENDPKYNFTILANSIVFGIKHPELNDAGVYTLKAENDAEVKTLALTLTVLEKPTLFMEDHYVMEGEETEVICKTAGYPESAITWSFTPCSIFPRWPNCMDHQSYEFGDIQFQTVQLTDHSQTSTLKYTFTEPGRISCTGVNTEGSHTATVSLIIGDLNRDLQVWGVTDNSPVSVGDAVELECGALVYNFTGPLNWYKDNHLVESDPNNGVDVVEKNTKYSYRKSVVLSGATKENSGSYDCRANEMDLELPREERLELLVHDATAPHLEQTNMAEEPMVVFLGGSTEFLCVFDGIPRPTVRWYKDDVLIEKHEENPNTTIHLYDDDTKLFIKYTKPEHQGTYKCVGENKVMAVSRSMNLELSGIPKISRYLLWGIPAVVLLLLVALFVLLFRYCKTRRTLKQMKEAGLANFEEGSPECINPALSLDEQADLLPYNKDFEFPRENLKLGKQLGAGAFGIVVKAQAKGIVHYEEESTVAVKMVKPNADNEVMRALISELKIMVHLGQHVNVVNLLGAVTKDIAKSKDEIKAVIKGFCYNSLSCFSAGKVMVIVEYCRYGNVQNFLQKNREEFIDQINPETGMIDHTIQSKEQRWSNDSGYEYNR